MRTKQVARKSTDVLAKGNKRVKVVTKPPIKQSAKEMAEWTERMKRMKQPGHEEEYAEFRKNIKRKAIAGTKALNAPRPVSDFLKTKKTAHKVPKTPNPRRKRATSPLPLPAPKSPSPKSNE